MKQLKRLVAAGALALSLAGIGAAVQPAAASWACAGDRDLNVGVCVNNPFPDGPPAIPVDRPGPHPLIPAF